MLHLDILGVQAFVAIAELGSFTAAANHMDLSQAALSRRLKKLEDGLGVMLIARTTRCVALTPEGSEFLPKAQRVVGELAASLDDLRSADGKSTGGVKIGCLPTLAALLPSLLREYSSGRPNVRVQVVDRSATDLREELLRGELDFAITTAGTTHPKLDAQKMFSEDLVAVCPASHPFAQRRQLTWRELADVPLVSLGTLSGDHMLIEAFVQRHQLQLEWTCQVEHLATAMSLVAGGTGIAVLPTAAVAGNKDESIKAVPLRGPPLKRDIVLVRRKHPLSHSAKPLYDMARSALGLFRAAALPPGRH